MTKSYPWYTPYQFAGNKPIWAIDLDGLEEYVHQYLLEGDDVTLIRKITNSETIIVGGYGAAVISKRDKRTGKHFPEEELNKIQYQYFDANGESIPKRRNRDGNLVFGDNEFLDVSNNNWFGFSIYIGPDNPSIIVDGKEKDDYRREPQDLTDAAARTHDQDYGLVGAAGFHGAVQDRNTIPADIALVQRANRVISLYEEGAIDSYTGEPISKRTLDRATKVAAGFTELIKRKAVGNVQYFLGSVRWLDSILEQERDVDSTSSQPTFEP